MKKTILLAAAALFAAAAIAQGPAKLLNPRTVTVFKNNQSLVYKTGKVPVRDGRYVMTDLPDALYGTFWLSAASGDLSSVFSKVDSVGIPEPGNFNSLLPCNVGKKVSVWLNFSPVAVETGTLAKVEKVALPGYPATNYNYWVQLKTQSGTWATFSSLQITRIDFFEEPVICPDAGTALKKPVPSLQANFKSDKAEQEIGLLYLTGNLGWLPMYSLTLADKGKSRLSLRAEIINDAEDLGDAELRLAVGVPNFSFANRPDWMVFFGADPVTPYRGNVFLNNMQQSALGYNNYIRPNATYEDAFVEPGGENAEGAQAEDFFFYTVRPGTFPKNSRYQVPVFETAIEPEHFYECRLPAAGPGSFSGYYNQSRNQEELKNQVAHFVEFTNPVKTPFTTGVVNINSQSGDVMYPLSQDKLPYTPAGAKCKVKIAETPEIKVTNGEGDVGRKEDAFRFFSRTYDEVTVEGQVCVTNYKNETVRLKVKRSLEGMPLSSEQGWTTTQEQATLRANPSFELEWAIELKPGEEKKWKYSYKVYVNL
ncbi:MAG: DUF4139 domain-containing protein [Saprospiraceae bacterium]|nr:DUF4139 domain-containing protein [Lewinellaceae bacterium]